MRAILRSALNLLGGSIQVEPALRALKPIVESCNGPTFL
jgi:hypothetical protein